ncbi:MAG TPA: SRPBCC family protein [Vicinamibacterales bacterium]|nr:SRPBCC family protein [Vicinamibacterales bacterium]
MTSMLDVSVTDLIETSPDRVRHIMFDPRQDPTWMAAVKSVELLTEDIRPGARVRRIGTFLGRTLRWTTEVTAVSAGTLDLNIVDGPMRGTVTYRIEAEGVGSRVTIRNVGHAPGFAPRWLLTMAMRRSLAADLRRLKHVAEQRT